MAENAFLAALGAYLTAAALIPKPKAIGIAEPDATSLPAVVLSLEQTERAGNGLGERATLVTDSALPWQVSIALDNPVLPEEPSFRLLDNTRTVLILPHGGLVQHDGSEGPLTGNDLTVKVDGTSRPVVASSPTGAQVSADPVIGQLMFGSPLPATGSVDVTYFLGQWEQRLARISGTLRVDTCSANVADTSALSAAVVDALLHPTAKTDVRRLLAIGLTALSSVGMPEAPVALRRRTARFSFVFEQEINQPESSGGIIRRVPITTRLNVTAVDKGTGAISTTVTTVSG